MKRFCDPKSTIGRASARSSKDELKEYWHVMGLNLRKLFHEMNANHSQKLQLSDRLIPILGLY